MQRIQIKGSDQKELQIKYGDARIEVKEQQAQGEGVALQLKAYVLAFGNIDSWGDIILPGACDKFLASETADRMALCWQHDRATVIGKITDKGVDDYGMWIEAEILPTTAGNDAAILIRTGAVKEFSIGYLPDKYHYEKRDGYNYDIRVLEEITIYEASPVTIAANPKAVVVSAKSDPQHTEAENNPKQHQDMTPEEIKTMQENIVKEATEKVAAEMKAKDEKIEAQEKSIRMLDETAKDQQKAIEELRKQMKDGAAVMDFKAAFRAALEEKKPELKKAFDSKAARFDVKLELKTVYDIGTGANTLTANTFLGIDVDPTIHGAAPVANVFVLAFGIRPRTANKLGWIEATAQNGAGYVAELAQNTNKSDVAFAEKTRAFAKIAHTMRISTEFTDWFEQLYNYCTNEGVRMIWNKIDDEICNGAGVDVTYPNKIYGLVGSAQHTVFSHLGSYQDATLADVIFDGAMQIAKEGYNANAAFVTWGEYAILRGLKDANGNYIFDQARSLLGGIRVYPTARLSSGEVYIVDTSCVEVYAGNSFELEFIRNGVYDAYDVYFRKAVQVKITTNGAKGVIYSDDYTDDIAAMTVPGAMAAVAAVMEDVHDDTSKAITTKAAV